MSNEYTAKLVDISDIKYDSEGNALRTHTVVIFRDGAFVDLITVNVAVGENSIGNNHGMSSEYTAKLIESNEPHYDIDGGATYTNTVVIYKGGRMVNFINVESSEGPSAYADAVAKAIGSYNFEWIY